MNKDKVVSECSEAMASLDKLVESRSFDKDQLVVVNEIVRKSRSSVEQLSLLSNYLLLEIAKVKEDSDKKHDALRQSHLESLKAAIEKTSEESYKSAYSKIEQELLNLSRCGKCGNNKLLIKHDKRHDILVCTCNICGFEWDKEPLNKNKTTTISTL